jgi:hypothetical protein
MLVVSGAGMRVPGRKRGVAVDALGLIVVVVVAGGLGHR